MNNLSQYQKHYSSYSPLSRSKKIYYKNLLSKFPVIGRDSRILEFGCGSGSFLQYLAEQGYHNIYGIDLSNLQIDQCKSRGISTCEVSSIEDYIFSYNSQSKYDYIFAFDVFEHLQITSLSSVMGNLPLILKENGLIIFQVPNASSPFFGRLLYGDLTHVQPFTNDSLTQFFSRMRNYQLKIYPIYPCIYSLVSALRVVIWIFFYLIYKLAIFSEQGSFNSYVSQNLICSARLTNA